MRDGKEREREGKGEAFLVSLTINHFHHQFVVDAERFGNSHRFLGMLDERRVYGSLVSPFTATTMHSGSPFCVHRYEKTVVIEGSMSPNLQAYLRT